MTRSGYPVREAFPVPIGRLGKYIFFGGQKKNFFLNPAKKTLQRHFKNTLNCYFEGCNQIGWLFGLQIYLGILYLECLYTYDCCLLLWGFVSEIYSTISFFISQFNVYNYLFEVFFFNVC